MLACPVSFQLMLVVFLARVEKASISNVRETRCSKFGLKYFLKPEIKTHYFYKLANLRHNSFALEIKKQHYNQLFLNYETCEREIIVHYPISFNHVISMRERIGLQSERGQCCAGFEVNYRSYEVLFSDILNSLTGHPVNIWRVCNTQGKLLGFFFFFGKDSWFSFSLMVRHCALFSEKS